MKMTSAVRDEMILSHMPQVQLLARRQHQRYPQVELEDLVSVATIGLIQAVDRFDPSRGFKLKTLTEHRIRGAMPNYLRQIDPLPRNLRQFQKRRDALVAVLCQQGKEPAFDVVASGLGITVEGYLRWSSIIADTGSGSVS